MNSKDVDHFVQTVTVFDYCLVSIFLIAGRNLAAVVFLVGRPCFLIMMLNIDIEKLVAYCPP